MPSPVSSTNPLYVTSRQGPGAAQTPEWSKMMLHPLGPEPDFAASPKNVLEAMQRSGQHGAPRMNGLAHHLTEQTAGRTSGASSRRASSSGTSRVHSGEQRPCRVELTVAVEDLTEAEHTGESK